MSNDENTQVADSSPAIRTNAITNCPFSSVRQTRWFSYPPQIANRSANASRNPLHFLRGRRAQFAFQLHGRNGLNLLQVERARFQKWLRDRKLPAGAAQGGRVDGRRLTRENAARGGEVGHKDGPGVHRARRLGERNSIESRRHAKAHYWAGISPLSAAIMRGSARVFSSNRLLRRGSAGHAESTVAPAATRSATTSQY